MPRPATPSATSALALQPHAGATPARLAAGMVGETSSRAALEQLNAAVGELNALAIQSLLTNAINALNAGDAKGAADWAFKALDKDERSGPGWCVSGLAGSPLCGQRGGDRRILLVG